MLLNNENGLFFAASSNSIRWPKINDIKLFSNPETSTHCPQFLGETVQSRHFSLHNAFFFVLPSFFFQIAKIWDFQLHNAFNFFLTALVFFLQIAKIWDFPLHNAFNFFSYCPFFAIFFLQIFPRINNKKWLQKAFYLFKMIKFSNLYFAFFFLRTDLFSKSLPGPVIRTDGVSESLPVPLSGRRGEIRSSY